MRKFETELWEGWTIQDFIEALHPQIELIASGESYKKPFTTKVELKKWCTDNQPYYKKYIPEVVEYFWKNYFNK
ncbi:MAG: hypothetical protein RSC93_02415 [Erysipelotrichaceae bacterium]